MSFTKEGDELDMLDRLIASTEQQLILQKELKQMISLFKEQQQTFIAGAQTKEVASQMITSAACILELINSHHYRDLFPSLFLQELELFSSIAHKKTLSAP